MCLVNGLQPVPPGAASPVSQPQRRRREQQVEGICMPAIAAPSADLRVSTRPRCK
eukprot:CAMPEP_0197921338 /NCGR_PEP_ID=MMETSP1439-20131203/90478_1 /TAXON_ID=66791 /ORGANISM="Gonyaulax spinifera, Strain CCMP409" /LENGTH=54 /DNA_ID=CAMNT_0043543585 /DNA_START=24 /DNA_END=188 /DNA_ORIENTATION=+